MDILTIQKEIKSPALRQIVESLVDTHTRVKDRGLDYRRANVEIVACKHIIQSVALDWAYSDKLKSLKKISG